MAQCRDNVTVGYRAWWPGGLVFPVGQHYNVAECVQSEGSVSPSPLANKKVAFLVNCVLIVNLLIHYDYLLTKQPEWNDHIE